MKRLVLLAALMASIGTVQAGSATWNLNPADDLWHAAANWTPATVPNGESDTASFGASNTTSIRLSEYGDDGLITTLDKLVFEEGASSYTITIVPEETNHGAYLEIFGEGVINSSGTVQNIIVAASGDGRRSAWLTLRNDARVGDNVVITNQGGASPDGDAKYGALTAIGWIGSANAGRATFINEGSTASGTIYGGFTNFYNYSSAEDATFINNPGTVSGAAAGHTLIQTFLPGGNLGTSTFIANPATVPGAEGGWVEMDVGTCAGTTFIANGATVADCQAGQIYAFGAEYGSGLGVATFIGNGGNGANAEGGLIDITNLPLSNETVVIANAGTNGGLGGTILLEGTPERELVLPQFRVFGNGTLDLVNVTEPTMPIGSLAGSGSVLLAGHNLAVGSNKLTTIFSGVIQQAGGLTKAGTGTFTLSGANTYTGGTTITGGTLQVSNKIGSATGVGAVKVSAGTLGGNGTVQGAVTIGTGSGSGAILAPSVASNRPETLTLQKALKFKADGTYTCKLNTKNARADQVIAREVTIETGAQFDFQAVANKKLPAGAVFTVVSNTSTKAIIGAFVNLPDGSTFSGGRNSFQANYEGGDGNDLTLTVLP